MSLWVATMALTPMTLLYSVKHEKKMMPSDVEELLLTELERGSIGWSD
jgi:hypothetical protein